MLVFLLTAGDFLPSNLLTSLPHLSFMLLAVVALFVMSWFVISWVVMHNGSPGFLHICVMYTDTTMLTHGSDGGADKGIKYKVRWI